MDNDGPVQLKHHVQHRYPHEAKFCGLCGATMRLRVVLPESKKVKVCDRCGFVDFQGPKLAAGCLVVREGSILLLKRGIPPRQGYWTFPGGYVDLGESPLEAAVRETYEEVGVKVAAGGLHGVYTDPASPRVVVVVYLAEPGPEAPGTSHEAIETRYFGASEIPWDSIAFSTTQNALSDWINSLADGKVRLR
jgi:8-oxo-dGTP diphosphatase